MALRKVKLYGKLGQLFGKEWMLDVNSTGEAIRAIDTNTNNEFSKYLLKNGTKKYYKICVKNKNNLISKDEINLSFGKGDIYIIPTIKGSGKYGQLIAGVVLIAVSYYSGFGATTASFIRSAGISLFLGGVAQLLAPNPNAETTQRNSYLFQGNATTTYQGSSVGIIYGRALVPPMPVCVSTDNSESSTYEGAIINLGYVGTLSDSLILYSYKSGTATLCGFDEFTDISIPPKKYKTITPSGGGVRYGRGDYMNCNGPIYGTITYSPGDSVSYDGNCTPPLSNLYWIASSDGTCTINGPSTLPGVGTPESSTTYSIISNGDCFGGFFGCGGSLIFGTYTNTDSNGLLTLSDEDTESDAIARLLNSLSWSAWQTTPVYPYYYRNPTNFDISYREVKTKSITLPDKYNPNFTYKYSATIQRRVYGSSDPWVDAETIETEVIPDSNRDLTLPEVTIPTVSGYESKISSISLNYA